MSKRFNHYWIIISSLALSFVLYGFYLSLAQPLVPYMDTMLYLVQIDQILKGELSWLEIYGSGEHRGILYPFITCLEWVFWGMDSRISTFLTGIVIAITFFYWLSVFLNAQPEILTTSKIKIVQTFTVCLVAAMIIVSPAGFELWTLDLGFAQLSKNFLIVTFLYLLAIKQSWAKNFPSAIGIGIYGGFLILFATYGWSYPFLIACLFALIFSIPDVESSRWKAGVVIFLMLSAQVVYISSGHGVFDGESANGVATVSITNLVKGVLYGASTALIGKEVMEKVSVPVIIPLLLGGFVLLIAALAVLISLLEREREKIFLASLLVFSLTVLAGVAVARGATLFTNTGASRYFVDFVWLLLAPLAIVFTASGKNITHSMFFRIIHFLPLAKLFPLARLLALILLVIALFGHLLTWYVELKTAPYRAAIFKEMAEVYKRGVIDEDDAALLQSPFSVASKAIGVAQFYNLSVLRDNQTSCSLESIGYSGDWYLPEQNYTRWLKKQGSIVLGECRGNVMVKGYVPEGFNARELIVSYSETQMMIPLVPGAEFSFAVQISSGTGVTVNLELNETTIPANIGINTDTRELGLLLTYVGE